MSYNDVLSLLRSGALEQAEKEYFRLGLNMDRSSEDVMALGGRILKARALEHTGEARQQLALQAAEKYAAAHARFGGTFSGINTAALYLVGKEKEKARSTARSIQNALKAKSPKPGANAYYHMATAAEAWLILGDTARAEHTFADAIPLDPHNYNAHASTLKQFDMLLAATGRPNDWLARFRPPKSLHFAGHLFADTEGGMAAPAALQAAIDAVLSSNTFGAAYGALAAGSDIVIAERLLAHGIELHLVQPCPHDLFSDTSLAPFGSSWRARFDACLQQAASCRIVSKDSSMCDGLTTAFASETAMGLAILRAQSLATVAEQLVVWDGNSSTRTYGTARDAHIWHQTGRAQHIVPFPLERSKPGKSTVAPGDGRHLKAMLFADVHGYSQLTEKQVPPFIQYILRPLAALCETAAEPPQFLNTWGDGLFLVFDAVDAAADMALRLQKCFHDIDLLQYGLPKHLAMRIAGHYGPAHVLEDPFLAQPGLFGREVTVAARIEPVTAPGSVFVSEPFACALAVGRQSTYRCEPLAAPVRGKDGQMHILFSLRGTPADASADG